MKSQYFYRYEITYKHNPGKGIIAVVCSSEAAKAVSALIGREWLSVYCEDYSHFICFDGAITYV